MINLRNHRSLILFIGLLLCQTNSVLAQENEWLSILSTKNSVEVKKQELDSFLSKNKKILTSIQLADFYHDLGNQLYYRSWLKNKNQEYLDSAIRLTRDAVELKLLNAKKDTSSLAKSLYNLGFFYSEHKMYFESIRTFSRLTDIADGTAKSLFGYLEVGMAYTKIGDYEKAIENFNSFLYNYNSDSNDGYWPAVTHLRLADTFSSMGHKEYEAQIIKHLNHAEIHLNTLKEDLSVFYFQLNLLRGNVMLYLDKNIEAINNYKLAHSYAEDFNNGHLAVLQNSFGVAYQKLNKSDSAEIYLKKSIALDNSYSLPYENLGDVYIAENDFKKGLLYYQKGISLSTTGDLEVSYDELASNDELQLSTEKTYLLSHLVAKANAWLDFFKYDGNKDHLNHALATFERADQLIDIIRTQSTEYQSKLYWREQSAELYMKAVEACFLSDDSERAYYFIERNKALLLLEDITHEKAKELSNLPDSIAKREFDLKRAIHLAENRLKNSTVASQDAMEAIKRTIFDHKRSYERFMDSITLSFPDYARLKSRLKVLPLEESTARYATPNQATLQYILNEEQGYGLLNTNEQTILFELREVETLNAHIEQLQLLLSKMAKEGQDSTKYHELAHAIFRVLLPQNIYSQIKGKQLIIVPDYLLQKIPFEALVTSGHNADYLIAENEIRYAYSLSYLDAKSEQIGVGEEKLLAVAPIEFKTLGLANLGFSGREVNEVKQILGGETLLHEMATKAEVLKLLKDYKIIHLSTHADIDENGNHWVAFSDEFLYLNEIYASKNQADMVVLSACNTSRGELKTGEGVMSLARAFFNSGAKSVISSLWQVPDKSGKDIMVEFYKGLDKGMTKSAALRAAKLSYLQQNQNAALNPSFWAALIVIGDNSPVKDSNFFLENWIWILVVLALLFFVVNTFRKKRAS